MEFDDKFGGFKGTKKAFLDQKKKEKQQKEELKKQILSCIKIQTYWKYKNAISIEFEKKLEDFTKKMKDVKMVKSKISAAQQEELASKILVAYPIFFEITLYIHTRNCKKHMSVLLEVISLLIQAKHQSIMKDFFSKDSKYPYIYRMVLLSLSLFSQLNRENQMEQTKLDEFLGVCYKNCKHVRKDILVPSKYLNKLLTIENNFVTWKGVRKSIKFACFNKPNNEIILKCIVTSRSFEHLLKSSQAKASKIFKTISYEQYEPNQTSISYLRNRVNNYIQIWSLIDIDREDEHVLQGFSHIFMNSLENLVRESKEQLSNLDQNYNQEMEIEEENHSHQMIQEGTEEHSHNKVKFYKQFSYELSSINLSVFVEDKTIKLFCNMINHLMQKKPLTPQVLDKISQICGQFLMMSKIRNAYQLGLKIKLAQNFNLLKTLYNVLALMNFEIGKFRLHSKALSNVVGLFCILFKKKLNLMDDEEFFGTLGLSNGIVLLEKDVLDSNFNLQEIKQLIDFFNLFAFKLLYAEAQPEYKQCEKKVVTLLKQLYSRDSRKKFYDNWILQNEEDQIVLNNFNFKKIDEDNLYMSRLLNKIPHIFSFEKRYQMMKKFIQEDQKHQDRNPFQFYQMQDEDNDGENNIQPINSKNIFVQRGNELNDAFAKFHNKNMKALYKITFVDEHGFVEEGIDGGGIIKEFINSVVRQGFDPTQGLFIETPERTLMPAPNNKSKLARYQFLGQIVGKAIYENILIEPVFSKVFLNQILEKPSTLEDLQYVDKELYKMLMNLKHTKDNVEDYALTFAIDDIYNGTVELKHHGSQIPVTNENKYEYISLYAQYKLNSMNEPEAKAFRDGFASVIDQEWLSMFNHDELQLIISGKFTCFDVQDLNKHTLYRGYKPEDLTIILFWQTLESFSEEEKGKFLHFVTSCSRPPTLGFKQLNPQFCIQMSIDDSNPYAPEKLPTSSTCMNILKLPNYQDGSKLKIKLLEAIYSGAGFDLS